MPLLPPDWRRVTIAIAIALCASVAVLTWFGFRAIREWQRASALLLQQRANQGADILVGALTRDMQAVQRRVLVSADWVAALDRPTELASLAATAFARYPYPDSFFAMGRELDPATTLFFVRSDRIPRWAVADEAPRPVPVQALHSPAMAATISRAIHDAIDNGRRFAMLETTSDGTTYQVIAHLRYSDEFGDRLVGVLGFMVDLEWARDHYFGELAGEVLRTTQAPPGVALFVVDEQRKPVTTAPTVTNETPISARDFSVMFFDPLLAAVGDTATRGARSWQVRAVPLPDPPLSAAMATADRTVLVAALAAITLVAGLALVARGVSKLEAVSALRAEFVATVTHELNTPIATIRAAGDTLADGRVDGADDQREYGRIVVEESKRLARLVDNVLAMARITDVTQVYWFEPLDVHEVIEVALQDFAEPLRASGLRTRLDVPHDLPPIRADRRAIRLMLDNLIDNAIRYSQPPGQITIAAAQQDGAVVLRVEDEGPGIPPALLARVTDKFVRGTSEGKGSGLGLAIVKRVAADHGGELDIRSTVDTGTSVFVRLPVAERS